MTARSEILRAIRRHTPPHVPLPALEGNWIRYPDAVGQFTTMLQAVGGTALSAEDRSALAERLRDLPEFVAARRICSLVDEVPSQGVDLEQIDDPHDLADLDFAIVPAAFGVAENGAVWIDAATVKHRVIYFLAQHVAVVLPAREIVHNMHEAYERLGGAPFAEPGFGMFLSGPSKTADIEQSLVIGAHGIRSLTVLLVD